MIYPTKPANFKNTFDIVGCFCVRDSAILFLHRQDHKPQGDLWGIPAGKVDPHEDLVQAMQRELKEEAGIELPINKFAYIDKVYTRYPEFDFTFHMFKVSVHAAAKIVINPKEHKGSAWVDPNKLGGLHLMEDIEECIKLYYDYPHKKTKNWI